MEVHHPHHIAHKKKWTEYLLEFCMLFLAVFLGFIAENIREHSIEKSRLNVYMRQMVENLKADTARCRQAILFNSKHCKNLDSLRYEIQLAATGKANVNRLYYFWVKKDYSIVSFKQAAITQLKNSGNMRLIENKKLANEIFEYYDRWVVFESTSRAGINRLSDEYNKMSINFFDRQYLEEDMENESTFSYSNLEKKEIYYATLLKRSPALQLLNNNSLELKKLNNHVSDYEKSILFYNSFLRLNYKVADSLISNIEKEYHFK
jgi:hypothetical protein